MSMRQEWDGKEPFEGAKWDHTYFFNDGCRIVYSTPAREWRETELEITFDDKDEYVRMLPHFLALAHPHTYHKGLKKRLRTIYEEILDAAV